MRTQKSDDDAMISKDMLDMLLGGKWKYLKLLQKTLYRMMP